MRIKAIKKLVDINILYAIQPSQLQQYRKMQAKNPERKVNVSLKAIRMYLILGLVYLFLFGLMGSLNQLVGNPGLFANLVSAFALFSMSQGFLVFYNVFYESKDLQSYRPYAFSEVEIIVGKSISVILTLLIAILPMFSYFLVLAFQGGNPFLGLPLALLAILILSSVITFLILIAVHFITKTAFFRKHQSLLSNVMIGLGLLFPMILVFYSNSGASIETVREVPTLFYPLHIFYKIAVEPFSLESIFGLLAWITATVLLFYLTKKKVVPQFYQVVMTNSEEKIRKERRSKQSISITKKGFFSMVLRYNLSLLGQGTSLVTVLFTSTFLPYFFMIGLIFKIRDSQLVPEITAEYWLPLFFVGVFIAVLNNNITSLSSIGLSLERENFDFLKSLPFDFTRYVKVKFWIIFAVQSLLHILTLLGLSLYLGLPILSMIYLLVVWFLASVILSCHHYFKDVKNLSTNWSSITDLVNRSNGIVAVVLLFIYSAILMALVIGSLFLVQSLSPILAISLGLVSFILLLGLSIFSYHYYFRRIVEQLDRM